MSSCAAGSASRPNLLPPSGCRATPGGGGLDLQGVLQEFENTYFRGLFQVRRKDPPRKTSSPRASFRNRGKAN